VLIIDSIGLLSSLYRYGKIAFIGGGFGIGIHNILEAATYGLPVIFGPNYKKFAEAVDLVSLGGAFPVKNQSEFELILSSLLKEKNKHAAASHASKNYVEKNVGATKFIIKKVFNIQNFLALFLLCLYFLKI
jgi:3-deoxy-D-manno-octulosonic-acid transferase